MFYKYIEIDYILKVGEYTDDCMDIIYDLECDPKDLNDICEDKVREGITISAYSKGGSINHWLLSEELFNEFKKGYSYEITEIRVEE